MKVFLLTTCAIAAFSISHAQQPLYDVTWGNGNGLRFWQATEYKLHMGDGAEYHYGPVTDFSIKSNMSGAAGRGWTWGGTGATPIAALNTSGVMQIAGHFNSQGIRIPGRYQFGTNQSAIEIEVPANEFNAIRAPRGSTPIGVIHFFDTGWQSGSPGSSAGSINIDGVTAVTIGAWNNPDVYFRRSDGFVGIGTTAPDAKLTVKGKVHAQEVTIDLSGSVAPDYVFEKGYKLASLEQVESYINKYHHLPEIPSAKEMDENGMNVREMNLLLLKKIEELTLYIVDQEKRIKQLEKK